MLHYSYPGHCGSNHWCHNLYVLKKLERVIHDSNLKQESNLTREFARQPCWRAETMKHLCTKVDFHFLEDRNYIVPTIQHTKSKNVFHTIF